MAMDDFSSSSLYGQVTEELLEALHKVRAGDDRDDRSTMPVQCPGQLPSREAIHRSVEHLIGALFPLHRGGDDLRHGEEDRYVKCLLNRGLDELSQQIEREWHYHHPDLTVHAASQMACQRNDSSSSTAVTHLITAFSRSLPDIGRMLNADISAAYRGDPAATSVDEVLLCYPGVQAIMYHRLAHALYRLGLPLTARIIAERSHSLTGIDIHPGATIGERFFIDHGTGVVIGESAIIGRNVRLYQAVTLGAKRFPVEADGQLAKKGNRHPIVEDDVVIYAGATILGRITLGKGAVIGGNVWLTEDVPAGCSVTQTSLQRPARWAVAKGGD